MGHGRGKKGGCSPPGGSACGRRPGSRIAATPTLRRPQRPGCGPQRGGPRTAKKTPEAGEGARKCLRPYWGRLDARAAEPRPRRLLGLPGQRPGLPRPPRLPNLQPRLPVTTDFKSSVQLSARPQSQPPGATSGRPHHGAALPRSPAAASGAARPRLRRPRGAWFSTPRDGE